MSFRRLHNLHIWESSPLSEMNIAFARWDGSDVSAVLISVRKDAHQSSAKSDGLFNPAIGNMVPFWGFHAGVISDVETNPLFICGIPGWQSEERKLNVAEALLIDGSGMVHHYCRAAEGLAFTYKITLSKVYPWLRWSGVFPEVYYSELIA